MLTGKIIFYLVAAITVLLLAARLLRRRHAERRKNQPSDLPPATSELAAGLGTGSLDVPTAASVTRAPAPPPLPAAALSTAPSANGERFVPSEESRAYRTSTWTGRSLFRDEALATDVNDLPRVRPEDAPNVDTSGCTFGRATPILAAFLPESPQRREVIKKELQTAGYYQPHAWHNLASLRWVLMMGSLLVFGVLLLLVPPRFEMPVIIALVCSAIIGWAVPRLLVRGQAATRLSEIERAMPDMLDMLNMSVSQGMTVQESLGRIASQMKPVYPALAQELSIVTQQASVGSLEQALVNFGSRIDLPEVHSFTTLIIQTERMGTSISDALQQYADNMRENLRQRADEKANAASFRLLFPTVLFLMPAVFIILLGPAIIELSDFFTGRGRAALVRNRQAVQGVTRERAAPQSAQP